LEQFRRHGYEARLIAAASLLAEFGSDSWPALRSFAKSGAPECEAFVGVIAGLQGVPQMDRLMTLTDLAKNPDPNTRSRVLEVLEELGLGDIRPVLEALARPEAPEDSAREAARESLRVMGR
jgi:HEAT repeat protein